MKIKDIGNLIVFDEFPLLFQPKQKIILTHLLHLEEQTLPEKLPMIFTTQKLADQLKRYCAVRNYKCITASNIIIVHPYEFIDIIPERRLTLQILFCASEEVESNNVLVLIRQNGQLNYIYGGNYTEIRAALLNDTFASWISHGVGKLYLNLKRMEEDHKFSDIDQMQKAFNAIEQIMQYYRDSKIHIYLPLFGFENFILKLAQRFPQRIKSLNLNTFFMNHTTDDPLIALYFLHNDNDGDEKIILFAGHSTSWEAYDKFKKANVITINIFDDVANCNEVSIIGYYELFYSPEPSPFHLQLLCMLVKPKRLYGIVDTFNNKSIVPKYLYRLCDVGKNKSSSRKQEKNLSFSSDNSEQEPVTIIGGAAALQNQLAKKSGPYLSDTESDDDE